jgi:RNA polymerase sigma factor (sigma-70 family)
VVDDLSAPTSEVWEEVRKLPRRQQQTVVLHYVSGLSMEEIGQTLDCSPGTVKAHLHRARQQLKTTLSDWEEV